MQSLCNSCCSVCRHKLPLLVFSCWMCIDIHDEMGYQRGWCTQEHAKQYWEWAPVHIRVKCIHSMFASFMRRFWECFYFFHWCYYSIISFHIQYQTLLIEMVCRLTLAFSSRKILFQQSKRLRFAQLVINWRTHYYYLWDWPLYGQKIRTSN